MNRLSRRRHRARRQRAGLSLTELLAAMFALGLLLAVVLPAIAGARGNSGVQQSMSNLMQLSAAHLLYAADWNGRQVTWARDDLGVYGGNPQNYNCCNYNCLPCTCPVCQPPLIAGFDCDGYGPWGYWVQNYPYNNVMFQPIAFPGGPDSCAGCGAWGHWRIPNLRPFHDYLNGRYHDAVFYAPNDATVVANVEDCVVSPCEFNPEGSCNPGWSSYAMSPAAMYHPEVMRSNAAGGFQPPWQLDYGYQSPGLFQALYPNLKSHMIEHNWIQGPPAECNPAYAGCEPYSFNQGIGSAPVALFYDGHVRLLPNTEVLAADEQVLKQAGGVDGLWHRGTAFGANGYFIAEGYDGVPLSHHVLTTDGILGRDTVSGAVPQAPQPPWPRAVPAIDSLVGKAIALHRAPVPFSPEEDEP